MPVRFSKSRIIPQLALGFVLLVLGTGLTIPAERQDGQKGLDKALAGLIQKNGLKEDHLGVAIYSTRSRSLMYTLNPDKAFTLASNMKLFTTTAALAKLGAEFTFNTPLLYRGTLGADGTLDGDLVVIGDGDPNISGRFSDGNPTAIFEHWADKTKEAGIKKVLGDLILDDHVFDNEFINPAWDKDDLTEWYAAPVGALSLNDNCIDLRVTGDKKAEKKAALSTSPSTQYVTLVNKTVTVKDKPRKPITIRRDDQNQITVQGEAKSGVSATFYVPVNHPTRFFGTVLKETLEERGVAIQGTIKIKNDLDPPRLQPIARHTSPLARTIQVANRNSQNFYAECLLKKLGHVLKNQGTTAAGIQCVQEFLEKTGVGPIVMTDGSGLARNNKASPGQIVALLRWILEQPFADTFVNSLAVSGEKEGTLKHRFQEADLAGKIHAKTGYISGVKTLSGFIDTKNKDRIIVSILVNEVNGKQSSKVNQLQEDILRLLITEY